MSTQRARQQKSIQQRDFTEEEMDRMVEVGNSFWAKFSKLCAEHIAMMPIELQSATVMYLGDKTSIYGSDYTEYLRAARKQCGS